MITKERVYVSNGKLNIVPKLANGGENYSISATDVRHIKFDKDTYKLKLVWSKGKKVSELVKEYGADYGFNFPFFWNSNPVGDCKIGNTVLNQGYDKQTLWHGFVYRNGQPQMGYFNIDEDFGDDGFLVKTTPLLLNGQGSEVWDWYRIVEGTATDIGMDANGNYVRAQRTILGLDEQGNLHVAVGDGRTSWDRGLDLQEMALYMKSKGCVWALNGDGGGSSVIADQNGSLGQNQGSNERAVNHAVLVFLNKEPQPEPRTDKQETLYQLSQFKQKNGDPMIDYEVWKDKLDENVPNWLLFTMIKRICEKYEGV
jgi:hypothetical protein